MLWLDKRYYSLNYYIRNHFGEKIMKISLDAGFTCPNRDGNKGYGGCIFCSEKGSGDFATGGKEEISKQLDSAKATISDKWKTNKYIAYFQAFTNTYAPVDNLERLYVQALERDDIVALSIATRPDCINMEVVELLKKLKTRYNKGIFVELGLQTSKEETAVLINRCFQNEEFEKACFLLKKADINVICHIIIGLPFETKEDIIESVKYACKQKIDGIKLQLLYVLKNTALAIMFEKQEFETLKIEEYVDILVSCIEVIPQNIVIHRLTGDGPAELLISPEWSKNKKRVLNNIDAELKKRNSFQGSRL